MGMLFETAKDKGRDVIGAAMKLHYCNFGGNHSHLDVIALSSFFFSTISQKCYVT
jgi:hypothetical protein